MIYGESPGIVRAFDVPHKFGTKVLYMPIKFSNYPKLLIPDGLNDLEPFVWACWNDYRKIRGSADDQYIYLSFQTSYVKRGVSQKRPGWHSDGFQTNDINYIWYSDFPTIFSCTQFDITLDHKISMEQFEEQAKEKHNYTISPGLILRLNQFVVHKPEIPLRNGIRTFVKVSFSPDKYNLKGNTHNPLFDYDWKMYDRTIVRNHPQIKEVDSVPEGVL